MPDGLRHAAARAGLRNALRHQRAIAARARGAQTNASLSGSLQNFGQSRRPTHQLHCTARMSSDLYGISALASKPAAEQWLQERCLARYLAAPWPFPGRRNLRRQTFAFPVGILLVRGDRDGSGQRVGEDVLARFDCSRPFHAVEVDLVLAGWTQESDGELTYSPSEFQAFISALQQESSWIYSGGTELLLPHLHLTLEGRRRALWAWDFSETIVLRLEQMLSERRIGSAGDFLRDLFHRAPDGGSGTVMRPPTWMIGDRVAVRASQKRFMDELTRLVLRRFTDVYMGAQHTVAQDFRSEAQSMRRRAA